MAVYDTEINLLDGSAADLASLEGKAALFVNVASKDFCLRPFGFYAYFRVGSRHSDDWLWHY